MRTFTIIIVTVTSLISSVPIVAETNGVSLVFPNRVGLRDISPLVLSNVNHLRGVSNQLEYLIFTATNPSHESDTQTNELASAMWLLGASGQPIAIPTLISNISFRYDATGTYPAAEGLVTLGEAAVPALLALVCQSTNNNQLSHAVRALVKIKGHNFSDFVEEQRSKLPEKDWKKLVRFAVSP
jgi:hypothetical protein